MKTILEGPSRRVGTIFHEIDVNFVEVCNSILKIAYPGKTLQNYADNNYEPAAPVENNCYLVKETGTVWGVEVEKNQILSWDGEAWEILPHKITEINAALQSLFFSAENISFTPPASMTATDVQSALEELAAVVFA